MNENKINIGYDSKYIIGKSFFDSVGSFALTNLVYFGLLIVYVSIGIALFQVTHKSGDKTGSFAKMLVPLLIIGAILTLLATPNAFAFVTYLFGQVTTVWGLLKFN